MWREGSGAERCAQGTTFRFDPQGGKQPSWMTLLKHARIKSYVNRIKEHDERLISGIPAVLRSWLLIDGPARFCLCKPISCRACPGTNGTPILDTRGATNAVLDAPATLECFPFPSPGVHRTSCASKIFSTFTPQRWTNPVANNARCI